MKVETRRWSAQGRRMKPSRFALLPIALLSILSACTGMGGAARDEASPGPSASFYEEIVAASGRDAADRALDEGRRPAEMLRFFGIAPGMRVAEISAGGGYTAELLARTVGPNGKVYAQNSRFVLDRFAQKPWTTRLKKPVMKNVVRLDRPFDQALPPDVKDLDAVLVVLFYHDFVWQKADRERLNRMVYDALKRGGVYGIIDHSAKAGRGLADVEKLHRIEENTLRAEVEKAGFELVATARFLRNPGDTLDWNASPRTAGDKRGTSDRFVLKFVKPTN
jgi:predicted methyltransferase